MPTIANTRLLRPQAAISASMAELGLAIASLASTAEVVCSRLYKYIQHVKGAEREGPGARNSSQLAPWNVPSNRPAIIPL